MKITQFCCCFFSSNFRQNCFCLVHSLSPLFEWIICLHVCFKHIRTQRLQKWGMKKLILNSFLFCSTLSLRSPLTLNTLGRWIASEWVECFKESESQCWGRQCVRVFFAWQCPSVKCQCFLCVALFGCLLIVISITLGPWSPRTGGGNGGRTNKYCYYCSSRASSTTPLVPCLWSVSGLDEPDPGDQHWWSTKFVFELIQTVVWNAIV